MAKKVKKGKDKKQEAREPIRLFIGVPARGEVAIQWAIAVFELMRQLNWNTKIMSTDEIPLSRARNRIVRTFMDSDCTHLLWIDSDTMPPSDAVHRLFTSLKEYEGQNDTKRFDIMSGLYFSRKKAGYYRPIAFFKMDIDNKEHNHVFMWGKKPFQVDAIGMGFCVIPRYVFEKLELPYYKWVSDPSWGYLTEDEGSLSFGEDMYFSEKARNAGFTIGVDPNVLCGHLGISNITADEYFDQIRLGRFGTEQLVGTLNTGEKLLNPEQKVIIQELMEYTGLTMKEVVENLVNGSEKVKEAWNHADPRTPREIYDFYRNCKDYIYDLTLFNYFYGPQMETLYKIVMASHGRILDYGAGIGSYLIKCWENGEKDLTHYDVPGPVLDFARWRYKKRGIDVHVIEAPFDIKRNDPLVGIYDTITCLDVLEHLEDPISHLKQISNHFDQKNRDSKLHINLAGPDEQHPMHITHDKTLHQMVTEAFTPKKKREKKVRSI